MPQRVDGFEAQLVRSLADDDLQGDSCLDPEVLAALADGQLAPDEREVCERHLSICSRCRAVYVAACEAESPTSTAATARKEPAPAPDEFTPARRVLAFPWRRVTYIAGPIGLAAAVLLAVRVADVGLRPAPARPAPPSLGFTAGDRNLSAPPTSTPNREEPSAPTSRVFRTIPEPRAAESTVAKRIQPAPDQARGQEVAKDATMALEMAARPEVADAGKAATLQSAAGALPAAPPAPAPPPPPRAMARLDRSTAPSAAGPPAASLVAPTLGSGAFESPSRRVAWRLLSSHAIQRTAGSEADVPVPIDAAPIAGAAVSDVVAWVVGRSGLVVRTVDGRTWAKVTSPSPEDLASITASSADAATVTTSSGASFVTTDGGRTWLPR